MTIIGKQDILAAVEGHRDRSTDLVRYVEEVGIDREALTLVADVLRDERDPNMASSKGMAYDGGFMDGFIIGARAVIEAMTRETTSRIKEMAARAEAASKQAVREDADAILCSRCGAKMPGSFDPEAMKEGFEEDIPKIIEHLESQGIKVTAEDLDIRPAFMCPRCVNSLMAPLN